MNFHNSYVTIDLDAISANFQAVCEKAGVPVMAVVKANGYGHGAVQVARHLQEKCAFFGVSSIEEALELRQAGLDKPILVLGHTPTDAFSQAITLGIRPAIFHYEDALALSEEALRLGVSAPFHFAVDTGMSRIGFQATEEDADICAKIAKLPNLVAEGLFSHFAAADCEDLTFARQQAALFAEFDAMLQQRGVNIQLRHMDNSAGLMNFSRHYDMVRAGIAIYGMSPSDQVPATLPLKPALSWHSRVIHVKQLPAGRKISYSGTYTTQRPTCVATLSIGYGDGYPWRLSNRFYVLIHGKKAPILGRVCMDQMMVDVTDIPDVQVNDPVVLVGRDGDAVITVEEIAQEAGSFHYEFICGINRRVPRQYRKNDTLTEEVIYL